MSRPRRTLPLRSAAALAALTLGAALPRAAAVAQRPADVVRGDSLLRRGLVFAAESAYYDAARHTPRDPAARLALGRYLAARGALRVGAVLMEEARFFGGDAKAVGVELAPVYARLGDYKSLASLPGSPLTPPERLRAEWLSEHAPAAEGPDSVTVPYEPQGAAGEGLGRVTLSLGGESVQATIDPAARGLVLDTAWARRAAAVKTFVAKRGVAESRAGLVGVALAVKAGALTLTNVPARLTPLPAGVRGARVGLDVLTDLAATFDEPGRTLTLRRGGRVARTVATGSTARLATLSLPSGVWVASAAGATALAADRGRAPLRGRRWTVDGRRGEIVVE